MARRNAQATHSATSWATRAARWRVAWSIAVVAAVLAAAASAPARAHHSFPVHFVPEEIRKIEGVIKEFRFRNPHGVLLVAVRGEDGVEQVWQVETNSPNVLRRRGWNDNSVAAGDRVTIEGYPARDGSPSMRVYRITYADGRVLIGQAPGAIPSPAED